MGPGCVAWGCHMSCSFLAHDLYSSGLAVLEEETILITVAS